MYQLLRWMSSHFTRMGPLFIQCFVYFKNVELQEWYLVKNITPWNTPCPHNGLDQDHMVKNENLDYHFFVLSKMKGLVSTKSKILYLKSFIYQLLSMCSAYYHKMCTSIIIISWKCLYFFSRFFFFKFTSI